MAYLKVIKENKEDFLKEIFDTNYEGLGMKLDILKSDIAKNKYEMKKLLIENISEYLNVEESLGKLK